ncbi:MAG: DUF58 domain-containing protein [Candidatus Bipolaricaulis sp.]|nr:DUF58 domain-containing protein [Candidatus Bipolaricaulis sp.]
MQQLIEGGFLERWANLRFASRRRQAGRFTGSHASPRAGMSVEFADYREYVPGDDFRYVDWNLYGRLDRLLVKTFVQEVDVPVYFLLDVSGSMRLGTPQKAHYGAQLVLALSYLALRSLDRVGVFPFSDRPLDSAPPRQGMTQFSAVLRLLSGIDPDGRTSISEGVAGFLSHTRETGLVVLVSDFLSDDDLRDPLARLRHRGDEVIAIQVLDREDIDPSIAGQVHFVDVETSDRVNLAVGSSTLDAYRRRFAGFQTSLRNAFLQRGIPLFLAPTDRPLEALIHQDLRAGGILE